jgi:hypothetical protein
MSVKEAQQEPGFDDEINEGDLKRATLSYPMHERKF